MRKNVEQFHLFRIRCFQDSKSFEKLLEEVGPRIHRFLKAKLPRSQDAEDTYSELCLRLWNYATQTKIDSFCAVAYTIARSLVAGFYQTQNRHVTETGVDGEFLESFGTTELEDKTISQIDAGLLKQFMGVLDEEEAQVILMRYLDQLGVREIALALGKTENATSVKLHRAIQKLRKLAKDKFDAV